MDFSVSVSARGLSEANIKSRVEAINSSNKFLKLIDEAVELMRKYHPQGERYYWILYYTYMSAYQPNNITEIINKLEPHLSQNVRINRSTYFRWRESALKAVEGILWGYEMESRMLLEHYRGEAPLTYRPSLPALQHASRKPKSNSSSQ